MNKIKNKNESVSDESTHKKETDEGTKESNEGGDISGVDSDNIDNDDYSTLFNKFIYSGSVSFLIILITFLITVNVLSVGYYQHKSTNITLVDDVETILTNSVAVFGKNKMGEEFTETYKNILNWHQKSNSSVGSFVYRLVNSVFPPFLIVIYFIIFCILQIYTFCWGSWVTLINAIKFEISTIIFICTLTILFLATIPLFYLLVRKGSLSIVSSVLLSILYFVIFSTLPFTGFASFYIFIMLFFNSYNKINKLFFNISPQIILFLIYILITFCSISLAQGPPKGVQITSGVIIGVLVLALSFIVIANLMKTFKPELFTNKFLKYFKHLVTVPEFEI